MKTIIQDSSGYVVNVIQGQWPFPEEPGFSYIEVDESVYVGPMCQLCTDSKYRTVYKLRLFYSLSGSNELTNVSIAEANCWEDNLENLVLLSTADPTNALQLYSGGDKGPGFTNTPLLFSDGNVMQLPPSNEVGLWRVAKNDDPLFVMSFSLDTDGATFIQFLPPGPGYTQDQSLLPY